MDNKLVKSETTSDFSFNLYKLADIRCFASVRVRVTPQWVGMSVAGQPIWDLTNLSEAKKPCFPRDGTAICFDVLTSRGKLTEDLFHLLRREKHAHFKAHCGSTCKWNGCIFFLIFFTWGQRRRKKHLWSSHGLNEERFLAFRHIKGLCPATPTSSQMQYAHHST